MPADPAIPDGRRRFLVDGLPRLVFVAVPALLILLQLGRGRFLFGHDVTMGFYHSYAVIGRALASGRLPLWNPHALCGSPMLAALQNAVLYPPTWLSAVLAPGAFWTVSVALHLSLAGFFSWSWLRRGLSLGPWGSLAGASMFLLSGFGISHVFGGHLSIVATVPWAAAALWRLERLLARPGTRRAVLLSLCALLMLLAGHPQTAQIGLIAVGARLLHFVFETPADRRGRLKIAALAAGALAAGLLMAAPQVLPTLELTGRTQRAALNDYEFSSSYSFPPESLATFIVPFFFGDSTTVPYWGRWFQWDLFGFLGVSSLALAALGALGTRRQRFLWLGLAVLGLLLAMGRHTPVFKGFFHVVPGASLFRVPARYLFLLTLSAVPLVAMGVDRLCTGDATLRRHAVGIAAAAGVLLLIDLGVWMSLRSPEAWRSVLDGEAAAARGQREELYLAGPVFASGSQALAARGLAIAALTLGAIAASLLSCLRVRSAWAAASLGAILGIELLALNSRFITDHQDEAVRWPEAFAQQVRSNPAFPFRLTTVAEGEIDAIGKCAVAGLDHAGGYDPMLLKRMVDLERAGNGSRDSGVAALITPTRPSKVADLLGVRYWLVPGPKQTPPGWIDGGPVGRSFAYENPGALPRAFLVGRTRVIPSDAERLRYLAGPDFDPAREVVLESGEASSTGDSGGEIRIESRAAGLYDLRVRSRDGGWLVLTEAEFPGWEARLDGAPAEILRADHALQAVRVPPGDHALSFRYRSRTFEIGLVVAALTAALGAALAGILGRRLSPPASAAAGS